MFPNTAVHTAGGRHAILIGSVEQLELDIPSIFADSLAVEQLTSVGFRVDEEYFINPILSNNELLPVVESELKSNTDNLAPCQFLIRKISGDPQLTIGENMSLLLSLDTGEENHTIYTGQIVYWNKNLPAAADLFRSEVIPTAMGRRWFSAAISTGAELLYIESLYEEALELADMAWLEDPTWQRNLDLVIEINSKLD